MLPEELVFFDMMFLSSIISVIFDSLREVEGNKEVLKYIRIRNNTKNDLKLNNNYYLQYSTLQKIRDLAT